MPKDIATNLINLPWGRGGVTVFGLSLFLAFLAASFVFFRQARKEFPSDEEPISFLVNSLLFWLIGARLVFFLDNFQNFDSPTKLLFLWRYPGLSFSGGFLAIIVASYFWAKKRRFQIWKLADQATGPWLIFTSGFFLGQWLSGQEDFYLIVFGLTLLLIGPVIWALKSYRSLVWYPSGKIGFALLINNAIFFFSFTPLAFLLSSGLYLEATLGAVLFFWSLVALFLRSESESAKMASQRISKILKTKNG